MGRLLTGVFNILLSTALKRMFSGAGLTLDVATGIYKIVEKLVNDAIINLDDSPAFFLNLLGLSGLDVALSLIVGAMLSRATIMQAQIFLAKTGA